MTKEEQAGLSNLLLHDLKHLAGRMKMGQLPEQVQDVDAAYMLNVAERLSRSTETNDHSLCLLICALIWEYRQPSWGTMPQFVMNLLSRIGLGPSIPMVDDEYSTKDGLFRPWGSAVMEAIIEARNYVHEVHVSEKLPLVLSSFQKDVWDTLEVNTRVGISAPTSAGKSFVLLYKALDVLSREDGVVVYIVPTLSLINQVTKDFRSAIARLEMPDVMVYQNHSDRVLSGTKKAILVLTQERALAALAQGETLTDAAMLIVDEIQNVERVANEDDERSKTLLDTLQEFILERKPRRAVISGPRVENIKELTSALFGEGATSISQQLPPVVNLTYSFAQRGKRIALRQHAPGVDAHHELLVEYPIDAAKSLFGKQQYGEAVHDVLAEIISEIGKNEGTIVFSPTSGQATNTAIELASRFSWSSNHERVDSLLAYVAETVHPDYALSQCLKSGVAFHHGKVPHHVRCSIERGFIAKDFHILTCSTSLMQGVNLPAKNIIARNPNLYVQKRANATSLTPYEFGNLRGRAGRLMKDFVGRSIILDETAFEQGQIAFDFPDKNVESGYKERFSRHRKQLVDALTSGEAPSSGLPSSDLLTVIRQAVIRFGIDAEPRLRNIGIELKPKEIDSVREDLKRLDLPRKLCVKLPYWDPVILDEVYRAVESGEVGLLPKTGFDSGFDESIINALSLLRVKAPYYYEKHFGKGSERADRSIVSTARKWMCEEPLRRIITWEQPGQGAAWKDIDFRLARVNQDVVYRLPKILRPLIVFQEKDNPLLGFMEMGAFRPQVRRLIALGLARETAIRTANRVKLSDVESMTDLELVRRVSPLVSEMNYWEAEQIKDLQWMV